MRDSTARPKEPKRTRRRAPGTGSVFQVLSGKHAGKWRASILIDVDGRKIRKYLQADTSAEVVERLARAQADADAAAALAASPTLAWWVARWLDSVRLRVRPSTLSGYRWAIGHVTAELGARPLMDLRPADIETMLGKLIDRGMAPSTAALVRRVLIVSLSDAERDGRIPRNVARSSRAPRVDPKERRRLSPAEVRALLKLASKDPRTDLAVHLAIGTGARVGELCALDWSDIDMAAGTMTVRGTLSRTGIVGPTKSRRSRRIVALPGFALAALRRELKRRPGATGPLLPAFVPGGRQAISLMGMWWRDLRDRAGVGSDLRFHDLRGTAATLALSAGIPPTEVARSLGHDPAVLMRTYAGAIPGGRELVADAIERALR
jgi:integrase